MENILLICINLFSFFINGITGFGATVLAQPTNIDILTLKVAIPFSTLISFPCLIYLGIRRFKNVDWKELGKIVVICAPGVFLGQYLAQILDANVSKVVVGLFVSIIAIKGMIQVFFKKSSKKSEETENADTLLLKIFRYSCLVIGGMLQGAYIIGGPLITVYVLYAIKDKTVFRDTMNWFWIIVNVGFNFTSQFAQGMYEIPELWPITIIGAISAFVGYLIGVKVHDKLSKELFLKITYVMLLLTGGNMFIQAAKILLA